MALLDDPDRCLAVLDRLTGWSVALAVAQVRRGAAAIKVSSPFAGSGFLAPDMYETLHPPFESRIARAVREAGGHVYTHTCGAIGDRLDLLCRAGVSGIECLDPPPLGDVDLEEAVRLLSGRIFIKGNVDPVNTLLRGDAEKVRARRLAGAGDLPRHGRVHPLVGLLGGAARPSRQPEADGGGLPRLPALTAAAARAPRGRPPALPFPRGPSYKGASRGWRPWTAGGRCGWPAA